MHALGQVHEQQRKDRDQHIIMHWNNVIGGQNNKNMEILSIGSHDRTQYDPTSSLQYSLKVSHKFFPISLNLFPGLSIYITLDRISSSSPSATFFI